MSDEKVFLMCLTAIIWALCYSVNDCTVKGLTACTKAGGDYHGGDCVHHP